MSNIKESLAKVRLLDGAPSTCLLDGNSGMILGADSGSYPVSLEVAATGDTEAARTKRKTIKVL